MAAKLFGDPCGVEIRRRRELPVDNGRQFLASIYQATLKIDRWLEVGPPGEGFTPSLFGRREASTGR